MKDVFAKPYKNALSGFFRFLLKLLKIFSEFKSIKNKDKEDIEGVKNIILWFDKQLKREGIKIQSDGTLSAEHQKKVKDILMDSVLRADGQKQLEYDGNALAQTNINLSRAITTLFLVTDAYNLTMQYSNDNKKDANKSAKNRAAQELSRIGVSAYMMAFVHNLLSRLCNSSLGGAFTLTALTSTINDSLSREVVGVPLTAKTQEQLEAIDKKNGKSKNPIKKALAYSIGKKSVAAGLKAQPTNIISDSDLYFANDFFINPHINQVKQLLTLNKTKYNNITFSGLKSVEFSRDFNPKKNSNEYLTFNSVLISDAFKWSDTKVGNHFWSILSGKWDEIVENYLLNNIPYYTSIYKNLYND